MIAIVGGQHELTDEELPVELNVPWQDENKRTLRMDEGDLERIVGHGFWQGCVPWAFVHEAAQSAWNHSSRPTSTFDRMRSCLS